MGNKVKYLVRKINKRSSLDSINDAVIIEDMIADAVASEFRTTDGKLSTWAISSLNKVEEAVLAFTSTYDRAKTTDFIIMNVSQIENNQLCFLQTDAGRKIAVSDLQNSHFDIVNITVSKLINCVKLYKDIINADKGTGRYIVRYNKTEICDILSKAISKKRLDVNLLSNELREDLKIT